MKFSATVLALLFASFAAHAAQVRLDQRALNAVDASVLGAVSSSQWLETANAYTTSTAPESFE